MCAESETPRSERPQGLLGLETHTDRKDDGRSGLYCRAPLRHTSSLSIDTDGLITELRFVQQADEDSKWLEVMHEDAFLFTASGLALQDPHHSLKGHTHTNMHLCYSRCHKISVTAAEGTFIPYFASYNIWQSHFSYVVISALRPLSFFGVCFTLRLPHNQLKPGTDGLCSTNFLPVDRAPIIISEQMAKKKTRQIFFFFYASKRKKKTQVTLCATSF